MFRSLFAYNPPMEKLSSGALRRQISGMNVDRARAHVHEQSYGGVPSVIYRDQDGAHGNFFPSAYRAICARPEWRKRLTKSYTGDRWVPRAGDRSRCELDCANSSDALLMNVFCSPRVLQRPPLCGLLRVEAGLVPEFGFRPRIPLLSGRVDRTEVDMRLGDLLVEAKLTESGFTSARVALVLRYRDLAEVFDVQELGIGELGPGEPDIDTQNGHGQTVRNYQAIRGVLAAYATGCSFAMLCDGRRTDLIEAWHTVIRAVRSYSLRSRLLLLTWQELAAALPRSLQIFLETKYGIHAAKGLRQKG